MIELEAMILTIAFVALIIVLSIIGIFSWLIKSIAWRKARKMKLQKALIDTKIEVK